jgi:hypothetical protein
LRAGGSDLESVPSKPPRSPDAIIVLDVDSIKGFDQKAAIKVQQILRGDSARSAAFRIKAMSAEDADKAVKAYWRQNDGWIEQDTAAWNYDEQQGRRTCCTCRRDSACTLRRGALPGTHTCTRTRAPRTPQRSRENAALQEPRQLVEGLRTLRAKTPDELLAHTTRIRIVHLAELLGRKIGVRWAGVAKHHSQRIGGGKRWIAVARTRERLDLRPP